MSAADVPVADVPPAEKAESASEDWIVVDDPPQTKEGLHPDAELDLVFICDCTGSMGAYIKAAQKNIQSIVTKISQTQGAKVRFALVSYRDHPPQEKTYVTRVHGFTEEVEAMREFVNTMQAVGGGDGPEAVAAGLFEALKLPWRPNATKVCVLIADAPPHGLEPTGDGFPDGDPDGRDPLKILRDMAAQDITCYSVGCEPALGNYHFARDFLCNVAEVTGGQAVALSSAAMLADVIINGSAEELALSKLQRQVEEEVLRVQTGARREGREITTEAAVGAAFQSLQARGVTSVQMDTDGRMQNDTRPCWGSTREQKSLKAVKAELHALPRSAPAPSSRTPAMAMPAMSSTRFGGGGYASAAAAPASAAAAAAAPATAPASATRNCLKTDLISADQVSRVVQKAQYQNRLL
ncbi:unnamed protein product [Effrenium voratum]|uniref:VWFA domain-containing protein n=1 Tax=Effrenium voratum TaxID=2562239 RepID=A0AA36IZT6_9DINO|nr:unnamed protein product [Effrenium voratum]CAJ1423584.1 unnamed protein product [Effrenium voratum]